MSYKSNKCPPNALGCAGCAGRCGGDTGNAVGDTGNSSGILFPVLAVGVVWLGFKLTRSKK